MTELTGLAGYDWRRQVLARAAEAGRQSASLAERYGASTEAAKALLAHSDVLLRDARVCRARLAALHHALRGGTGGGAGEGGLTWVVVHGQIDDRPVWGLWSAGRLECHPLLEARAWLLVDLGEMFSVEGRPEGIRASFDGPTVAVAMTLMRACDRLQSLHMGPSPARARRSPAARSALGRRVQAGAEADDDGPGVAARDGHVGQVLEPGR